MRSCSLLYDGLTTLMDTFLVYEFFSCCVISDIENKAKKDTKSVFKHLDEFLNKIPKIVIEKEAFQGPDNFTNVCEE